MKQEIKSIRLNDKVPENWRYVKSWEIEKLICEDFKIFSELDKYKYYKLSNQRYLWLAWLDINSQVNGSLGYLYYDSRVRGVLIIKEVSE